MSENGDHTEMNTDDFMDRYGVARLAASRYRAVDRIAQKLQQQFGAFKRHGVPVGGPLEDWYEAARKDLTRQKDACAREVAAAWKGHDLARWVEGTNGLGVAVLILVSLWPPLPDFPTPEKYRKYVGLHPGRATNHEHNQLLKAWALFRVAEPVVKAGDASPYRPIYDSRKERLPLMLEEGAGCERCDAAYAKRRVTGKAGWDCKNLGGPHLKAAHRHVDALGVTAQKIFLDAWRIVHGQGPRHGELA